MTDSTNGTTIRRIAVLGNHHPRQCGIASFTTDLSRSIAAEFGDVDCIVLAMNDLGAQHAYPPQVQFEIAEGDVAAYRRAADYLNVNAVDVLCLQHEYGIFGGKAGGHVLALLRQLRMPIVTTLHTILAEPSSVQRAVMDQVTHLSERLIVMSAHGGKLLEQAHGVAKEKIDMIPHGIPSVPSAVRTKDQLGVRGRWVMLTFGLLSPDKGIEDVIDALPAILERFPETVYIVLGATHPHVRAQQGETYRRSLERRALALGVASSLIFHNRFVSLAELTDFLSAADIYITPYLNLEQSTSGTLAYAVGAGKAVISTPYCYAQELLAEGRGILVPRREPGAIAREVVDLLADEPKRRAMADRAAAHGRGMLWPAVARRYVESFGRARQEHSSRRQATYAAKTLAQRPVELPEVRIDHLQLMTDGTGMLQHAAFTIPRYADGYCLDDNARALLVMTLLEEGATESTGLVHSLSSRYLAFVSHAFHGDLGRFRNFMGHTRRWTEECGSEDCHGRALWALGTAVSRSLDRGRENLSVDLFRGALPATADLSSPRAWAYALLGIDEYLHSFEGERSVHSARKLLAERLLGLYRRVGRHDWPWFEEVVTYCNARLSQAMIVSGAGMGNEEMIGAGLQSLRWLAAIQRSPSGYFSPIGSNGFHRRGGPKAEFDQQPVEACAMVSACLVAGRVTGDKRWTERARWAFGWFHGDNVLQEQLADLATGGCRDGLHADRANDNQGAESTLSYLLALLEMRAADRNGNGHAGVNQDTP